MKSRKQRIIEKKAYDKAEKHISKKQYKCMYQGCENFAIKSHSQQKGGPLKAIQENGFLYRLEDNLQKSLNVKSDELKFKFALKSTKSSSVFPGFCNTHEKIFTIFEDKDLIVGNQQQACALFYRTISYEKARKRREYDRWTFLQPKLVDVYGAMAVYKLTPQINEFNNHITKTCDYFLKNALDFMGNNNYAELRTKWIRLPYNIGVSCSSTINLQLDDYLGYTIKNPTKAIPSFTFNLIPTNDSTHIIVSWLSEHDEYATWLSDVFDSSEMLEIYLNRFCFCDSEDTCIAPNLFSQIGDVDKLVENMNHVFLRGALDLENILRIIKLKNT